MRISPAQMIRKTSRQKSIPYRIAAWFTALALCFGCMPAFAETADLPQQMDGISPEKIGWSVPEGELADIAALSLDEFAADDIPEGYLEEAEHRGRVEKVYYITSGETETVKSVMVYYPAGYDESDHPYNILYLLHGANGSPLDFLDPGKPTGLRNLLDHLIEDGAMKPMIVVAATYYPADGNVRQLPLAEKVRITASFPRELTEDIIPQVEEQCRTYAASSSAEDITASRDHRTIAGFSLGGVATWYVFLQQMQAFRWFLPISEASWDDGEGGTTGIYDSEISARTLYDAVLNQGCDWNDFMLFVAVGTEDEAFEIATNQMKSLLEYDEMFFLGGNTICSMIIDGTHSASELYTYFYHILPCLFIDRSTVQNDELLNPD